MEPTAEPAAQPPSTSGMTTKVVKGSLWTLAGQVAPLAISMVATPFTIRLLGSEGYGVFVLVGVIPNYFLFADFGMGMASTKFASEAHAQGDEAKEARIVRTAALIALITSLPAAAILFFFSDRISGLFNVPEHLHAEASLALKLTAFTFFFNFFQYIFNTPQLTRLRMELNALISSIPRLLGVIATPIVIYLGYGIVGAAAVLLVVSILTLAGHLMVSMRLNRSLFEGSIESGRIKDFLRFGSALVGGAIAGLLLHNLDRGVLPRLVSVEALAFYSVGFSLAWMIATFSNAMIQNLIPAFSLLLGDENRIQFQALYTRSIRLTLIWLIPVVVFLLLVADSFIRIWAGQEFAEQSVPIFRVVLAGMSFMILSYLPYATIMAIGRTDLFAKLYFAEVIPYFVVLVLLTGRFGALGTSVAWSLRAIVDCVLLYSIAKRSVGISTSEVKLPRFVLAAVPFSALAVGYLFDLDLTVRVFGAFLISFVAYSIIVWRLVLHVDERAWIRSHFLEYGLFTSKDAS